MIAALFPGQNSQVVGMAKDFYTHSKAAKAILDEAEATLPGLLTMMWEGPEETLKLTANQQPALVAAGAAAFAAYKEAGGELPKVVIGHSLGEYTAYVAANSLSVAQAISLVHKRGSYMQTAVPEGQGAMAAILKTSRDHIAAICQSTEGIVELANLNASEQTVISGETKAVALASEQLKEEGARVIPLKVSAPFHCSLMKPAADKLALDLAETEFSPLDIDLVCNVTANLLTDIKQAPTLLEKQVTAPVRWVESVHVLQDMGVERFIEFGSGKVLTSLMGRILEKPYAKNVIDIASLQEVL